MRIKSIRLTSQIIFFFITILGLFIGMTGFIYPYFFCPASPAACATCPLWVLEHISIDLRIGMDTLKFAVFTFGFLGTVFVIFGRAFCGWACPIGLLQELIAKTKKSKISIILKKSFYTLKPVTDKVGEYGIKPKHYKYIILLFIPITSYITKELFFTEFDPIGGITATIPRLVGESGEWSTRSNFWPKFIFVIVFFLFVFAIARAWCRFLCPIGAIAGIFNKVSFLKVDFNDNCTECGACRRKCPMKINIPNEQRSAECVHCGICVDTCKFDAVGYNFFGKDLNNYSSDIEYEEEEE